MIHARENKKTGKTTLSKSEGECLINQAGGVGQLGSFGDITKLYLQKYDFKQKEKKYSEQRIT